MTKKDLEIKVTPSTDTLKLFCVENAENIVGCGWYETIYCMKSCKFYNNQKESYKQKVKKAKFWNRR